MGAVLGQMVMTSISVVLPGLYFLLMVEPHPEKAYRYRFLMEGDLLERFNNAVSVGLVGYTLFVATIPFFNWLSSSMFDVTVRQAVLNAGIGVQLAMLLMLTVVNVTMAYLGLQK
jgi:hypothetical protein